MELRPPLHIGVVAIKKGAFGSPSTMVAILYLPIFLSIYVKVYQYIFLSMYIRINARAHAHTHLHTYIYMLFK